MATGKSGRPRQLLELFWAFLKLGLFTVGGGYAMIPQMQQLAVEDHQWLTEEEVVDCVAVSQSLPGIIAINMATYIGRKLYGLRGAVTATVGVVLPSFVIISLAVLVLGAIGDNPWLRGAFMGVKAAVCGLILVSVIRLGRQVLRGPFQWILMIAAFTAIGFFGINAIWTILAAALLGIARSLIRRSEAAHEAGGDTEIDADTESDAGSHAGGDAETGSGTESDAGPHAGGDTGRRKGVD